MKAQIIITTTGELRIITREGEFEAGREAIARLLAKLAKDVAVELSGPIEQHRHDEETHSHTHQNA